MVPIVQWSNLLLPTKKSPFTSIKNHHFILSQSYQISSNPQLSDKQISKILSFPEKNHQFIIISKYQILSFPPEYHDWLVISTRKIWTSVGWLFQMEKEKICPKPPTRYLISIYVYIYILSLLSHNISTHPITNISNYQILSFLRTFWQIHSSQKNYHVWWLHQTFQLPFSQVNS